MTVGIFMSRGTSLADWARQGILEREVAIYGMVSAQANVPTYLFVPDRHIRDEWRERVVPITVVGPSLMERLRILWTCTMIRGHNGRALIAPLLWSCLCRKALVLRFGYVWSLDMIYRGVSGWKLWAVLLIEWLACRRARRILTATDAQARYLLDVHGIS